MKKIIIPILLVCLLTSCKQKRYTINNVKASVIRIDSTLNAIADKELLALYQIYKDSIERQTSVIIGHAAKELTMNRRLHENPLANFISDAMRSRANELIVPKQVDFALVNFGGIRASLSAGEISVGNIFEISPFENELVILALRGFDLRELVEIFAQSGGQGVSGMTFGIQSGEAVNVLVGGEPIDDRREYIVATVDYLALGGDRMTPLLRARHILTPGIKVRDFLIDTIKRTTERGESIDAELDGRIYMVE